MNSSSNNATNNANSEPFFANLFERQKTIETLTEESRADADFYMFITIAAFITALGLIIDNPVVIVGAMLVAPILFPILAFGMAIVTKSKTAVRRSGVIIAKAAGISIAVAFVTALVMRPAGVTEQLRLFTDPDLFIFLLISFCSGVIAAFSWVKKDISQSLPGVAVSVSLLPPLAGVGVAATMLSQDILIGAILLFLVNLCGVTAASVLMFTLFRFDEDRKLQNKEIYKEQMAEAQNNQEQPQ